MIVPSVAKSRNDYHVVLYLIAKLALTGSAKPTQANSPIIFLAVSSSTTEALQCLEV